MIMSPKLYLDGNKLLHSCGLKEERKLGVAVLVGFFILQRVFSSASFLRVPLRFCLWRQLF